MGLKRLLIIAKKSPLTWDILTITRKRSEKGKDSNKASEKGDNSNKASEKGSNKASEKGSNKASEKGDSNIKASEKGSNKASEKGDPNNNGIINTNGNGNTNGTKIDPAMGSTINTNEKIMEGDHKMDNPFSPGNEYPKDVKVKTLKNH